VVGSGDGVVYFQNRTRPEFTSSIRSSTGSSHFGSVIVCRDENIYVNDPKNNKIHLIHSIPFYDLS
jgi:hypothetical protein